MQDPIFVRQVVDTNPANAVPLISLLHQLTVQVAIAKVEAITLDLLPDMLEEFDSGHFQFMPQGYLGFVQRVGLL